VRELRVARFRQLALDLGEPSGEDRWNMLPEQARLSHRALRDHRRQQGQYPQPGQGGDRGE